MLVLTLAMRKFGPARAAFEEVVRTVVSSASEISPQDLYTILAGTAQALDGQTMPLWIQHCGSMGHVLGYLPWFGRLGIITTGSSRDDVGSNSCVTAVCLGEAGSVRKIAAYNQHLEGRLSRVLAAHDAARACQLRPS